MRGSMNMYCILYVEDTNDIRAMGTEKLTSEGFKVLVARGPKEALTLIEEHADEIQAIFLDIMMPHQDVLTSEKTKCGFMTGYYLIDLMIEKLKKKVPIIVQTIYTDEKHLALIRSHPLVKALLGREEGTDKAIALLKKAILESTSGKL
jgi:CheY-like chemotaxis protein